MKCKCEKYRNELFAVVDSLDLSDVAISKHGPLGTPPSELVKLVLEQKDFEIRSLRSGLQGIYDQQLKLGGG